MTGDTQTLRQLQQENIRLKSDISSLREYVERMQRAIKALNTLQHSLDRITSDSDVYELLNKILTSAADAVDSENGSLLLLDEDTGELVFVDVLGPSRQQLMHYRLPVGVGVASWVVENGQPRLVEDARREPLFSPLVDQSIGFQTVCLLCVPLRDGKRPIGAIEVVNTRSGRPFIESDKDVLMLVARLASLAIVTAERAQE